MVSNLSMINLSKKFQISTLLAPYVLKKMNRIFTNLEIVLTPVSVGKKFLMLFLA